MAQAAAAARPNPYPLIDRSGVEDDASFNQPTPGFMLAVPISAKAVAEPATPTARRGAAAAASATGLLPGATPVARFRRRAAAVVGMLVLVNVAALGALFVAATPRVGHPAIISPGLLAYTFGLRHAVDADHIAAIDNVSRSLLESGRVSLLVGLWFSLGHSTVVVLLCVAIAAGSGWVHQHLSEAEGVGTIVGTAVSSSVLLLIGAVNLYTASKLVRQWRKVRGTGRGRAGAETQPLLGGVDGASAGESHIHFGLEHTHIVAINEDAEVESVGGLFSRCCPVIMKAVDRPWKMYPIGFLFGLGFDTATEVALLAICAMGPKEHVPGYLVLLLPALFAAGMSLIDTLDGIMMIYAYGWALVDPAQKIFFNLYLTVVSATIAIIVSVIEILGCLKSEMTRPKLNGPFWEAVGNVNDNFEYVGYSIMGLFLLSMLTAWMVYHRLFPKEPPQPAPPPAKRALQYPIVDRSGI